MTWSLLSPRTSRGRSISALLLLQALSGAAILAQDSHYWTNQYGTESWLLGGAVVGASADLASTYYNPAALAVIQDRRSLLTAVSLNWSRTSITAEDVQFELRSGGTSPLPTLISANLPISVLGSNSLQISYLQRTHVRSNLEGLAYTLEDTDSQFVATGHINRELFDSWFGVTWSKDLGSKHSVGVTAYVSAVSSNYSSMIGAGSNTGDLRATTVFSEHAAYDNIRLLAKAGYYYDGRPFSVGVTVTMPSVKLFNTYGETNVSQSSAENGTLQVLYANTQDGLSAKYRTPTSIAVGGTWYGETTMFYLTMEWFDGLDTYKPLEPSPFSATIPDSLIVSYGATVTRYGILNVAVGMKTQVAEKTFLYAALIRDASSLRSEDGPGEAIVNYDLYHATIGWQFMIDQTTITFGGIVGGGFVNNAPPSEFALFAGLPSDINVDRSFLRIGALLGISARF
jgi:hypothetical protein